MGRNRRFTVLVCAFIPALLLVVLGPTLLEATRWPVLSVRDAWVINDFFGEKLLVVDVEFENARGIYDVVGASLAGASGAEYVPVDALKKFMRRYGVVGVALPNSPAVLQGEERGSFGLAFVIHGEVPATVNVVLRLEDVFELTTREYVLRVNKVSVIDTSPTYFSVDADEPIGSVIYRYGAPPALTHILVLPWKYSTCSIDAAVLTLISIDHITAKIIPTRAMSSIFVVRV